MQETESVMELKIPMDAGYNWSVGNCMERFINGLKDRKLIGIKCPACGKVFVPPRMICEDCFAETGEWLEVSGEGIVEGFTTGYVKVDEKAGGLTDLEEPEVIALIKPDGADTCMVHRIAEAGPDEIDISMRVEAVWADETRGELADLVYFRPVRR